MAARYGHDRLEKATLALKTTPRNDDDTVKRFMARSPRKFV
jgi:hypothetical protein